MLGLRQRLGVEPELLKGRVASVPGTQLLQTLVKDSSC